MDKHGSTISRIRPVLLKCAVAHRNGASFVSLVAVIVIKLSVVMAASAEAQVSWRGNLQTGCRTSDTEPCTLTTLSSNYGPGRANQPTSRAHAEEQLPWRMRNACNYGDPPIQREVRVIRTQCAPPNTPGRNSTNSYGGSWQCYAEFRCVLSAADVARQRAQEEQRRQQAAAAAAQQRAAQERRAREEQERQREEEERLRQEEEARLLAEAERAQREEEDRLRREAEEVERARREELAQAGLEAVNRCNPPRLGNARWLGLGVSVEPGMYVSSHYPRGGDFSRRENYACQVTSPLAACGDWMCGEAVRIRMDHMVRRDVGEGALRNHGTCYDVAVRRVSAEMRYSPVPSRANIEQDGFAEPSSLFGPLRAARDAEWNARVNHVERMFRSAHQENVTRVAQCLESAGFNFSGQSLQEFDMWGTPLDLVRGGEESGARPADPD